MAVPNSKDTQFRTGDEQVETAKKGGIASGKARREKRAMKDTLAELLAMPLENNALDNLEEIQSLAETNGRNISVQEAIMLAQIRKAIEGDTKAAEYVRDTSGNKLKDALELSGGVNNPFAGMTTEELKGLLDDD